MGGTTFVADSHFVPSMLLIATVGAVFDHVFKVQRFKREQWPVPLAERMIVG